MSSLKDNAIVLIGSKLILYSASIVLGMVLTRLLSKHDYGSFMQINLIVDTLSFMFILGLPASIFYTVPKLKDKKVKRFLFQTIFLLSIIACTLVTFVFILRYQISDLLNNKVILNFVYILIALIIIKIFGVYIEPFYISTGRTMKLTKMNVGFLIFQFSLILLLLKLGYGLKEVLISIIIVSILKLTIVLTDTLKLPGKLFEYNNLFGDIYEQIKFSIPIGLSRVISTINQKLDQFMISSWFMPAEFAIYNRGAFDLPFVFLIVGNTSNIILPELVKLKKDNKNKEFIELWHQSIKKSILATYPFIAFFFTFAPEIFVVLFTKEYASSSIIFNIYMLAQVFSITIWGNIHIPNNNTKVFFYSNGIVICINIFLNYILYLMFGFYGPAIATVLARICGVVFHITYSCNTYLIKVRDILPWKYLFTTLGISILLSALVSIIKLFNLPNLLTIIFAFMVFLPLYIGVMSKINFLTNSDRALIYSWINPKKIWGKLRES